MLFNNLIMWHRFYWYNALWPISQLCCQTCFFFLLQKTSQWHGSDRICTHSFSRCNWSLNEEEACLKKDLFLITQWLSPRRFGDWCQVLLLHLPCLAHCVWGMGRHRVSLDVSSLEYVHLSLLALTDELRLLCVMQTLSFCVLNQNTGLVIWWYYALTLFTLQPALSAFRKWNRIHTDLALYTPKPFLNEGE